MENSIGNSLAVRAAQLLLEQLSGRMTESAEERLAFLAEAGVLLGSSLDPATTLGYVARLAVPRFADCCCVELVNEEGRLECVDAAHAVAGKDTVLQDELARSREGANVAYRIGDELLIAELEDAITLDEDRLRIVRLLQPLSFLSVPLIAGGRPLGVWSFAITESTRRFAAPDLAFARQLAARAALAVENTRLHAAEQRTRAAAERTADRLARLQKITSALASASTPEEVAVAITREGADALGAEAGVFFVTSADGSMLELVTSFGLPELETKLKGRRIPVGAAVPLAEAVRTKKPVLIDSPNEVRSCFPELEQLVPIRGGGLVSAPLIVHERVVGAFQFCFPESRHPRDTDRDFLLTLAPVGAQALERARLYEAAERARAELAVSEQRFRSLADALPQQVWIQNGAGKVEYFNARALEYFGISLAEGVSLDEAGFIATFLHPDDQARVSAAWAEAHSKVDMLEIEVRRRRADGVYRWHLNRASPLRGPDGTVTHWFGTSTDIESRKQVEAALQQSEARFRRLVETAILGVGFFGVDGTITYANEAALAITGYGPEDVAAGRLNWRALTPPEYREVDDRALLELARTGFCAPYEKEYLRKDGTRVPILMGATLFDRSAQQGVGFIVDLTELKNVEAAHAALVERDRIFHERLIGIVGHDLKNPLAAVLASANMLELIGATNRGTQLAVERINRSVQRMLRMIDQLFDFARTRQGDSLPISPTRFDLGLLCREVIDELALAHPKARITFEARGGLVGSWDRDRLGQVVSNLVGNALDYGAGDAVAVRVVAGTDSARIEVHNFGPPIPAADLPHVFDPYRRARTATPTSARNLGLGLYIVREVVRAHLGAIEVRSTADEGTCFTVHLPQRISTSAAG